MNPEKIRHHIDALKEKHRKLDIQIDLMESLPTTGANEELDIHYFKKKRLELKDEIALYEAKL